ncbi:uncharacterized protein V6R79_009048 [Siganus canaliculatus]
MKIGSVCETPIMSVDCHTCSIAFEKRVVMPLNQTSQNESDCDTFTYNPYIVPVLYFLMFPVALLLNGVAAWVSLHLKSPSTFVVYLQNLVAADIIITLTIPIEALGTLPGLPNSILKLSCYIGPIFYSTQYTCIALLGVISLDRFFKIMAFQSKFVQNVTFSKLVSASVWLILLTSTALPNIILSNKSVSPSTEISSCMDLKGSAGLEIHEHIVIFLNVFFWFVSVIIAVCYICITNKVIQSFRNSGSNNNQGKQKVKLRVFLVVVVFFVSFGPYHIVRIPYTFQQVDKSSYTSCSILIGRSIKVQKMNSTQSNTSIVCVRDVSVTNVVFPCLYAILFIFALVMNCLAAWVFFNIPSTSTFVVFLKNVVVADLLMTLTIPLRVLGDAGVGPWQIRAFHCRYSAVLFYATMYISILLLGLISLDRYLKIVRPFGKSILQKVRVGQMLCAAIWVVILSLALPNTILSDQPPQFPGGRLKCTSMKSKAGLLWHEGFNYFCQVIFWGTLALMLVCYTFISKKVYESYKASKSKSQASRKTKAKVFVVVGVFFICFAPFHFARVPYTLTQTGGLAGLCKAQNVLYIAKETTLWLSATNVCLDPLIYVFLCKMFRKRLTAALCCKALNKGATESTTVTSTQVEMSQIPQSNSLSSMLQ